MINSISLDECYVFDMLSILHVKGIKTEWNNPGLNASYHLMRTELAAALGEPLASQILASREYKALVDTNTKIFDMFEEWKKNNPNMLASTIDLLNYQRHLDKQALQKRFFPSLAATEQKMGYDKVSTKPAP